MELVDDLVAEFVPLAMAKKREAVQADFQDLLVRAAELLENSSDARARLASRSAFLRGPSST